MNGPGKRQQHGNFQPRYRPASGRRAVDVTFDTKVDGSGLVVDLVRILGVVDEMLELQQA